MCRPSIRASVLRTKNCTVCLAGTESLHSFKLVLAVSASKRLVRGIWYRNWRAVRPCQPLQLRLSSTCKGAGEDKLDNVPPLHTAASIFHALRSSCAESDNNYKSGWRKCGRPRRRRRWRGIRKSKCGPDSGGMYPKATPFRVVSAKAVTWLSGSQGLKEESRIYILMNG